MRNLKVKLGCTRVILEFSAVHHSPGSTLTRLLCRMFMGNALCIWLVILAESMKKVWKNGLESKGLNVNMGKIKILIASRDLHALQTSGRYHCELCRKGVRKNSIFCSRYSFWGRKKCSDTPDRIVKDPDFRCRRCLGNARAIDGRPCVLKSNLQMANLM